MNPSAPCEIIYNVTIKVDDDIAGAWLQWMLSEHIPDVLESNCFYDYRLVRLIEVDDTEGPTYAVQYFARSKEDYNRYITQHAGVLRQKSINKWGNKFIAFRSVMEIVH